MTLQELYELLKTVGIPVAYQQFTEMRCPPYIAYFEGDSDSVTADGVVVVLVQNIEIHLVTTERDLYYEYALQNAFDNAHLGWERSIEYVEKQKIFDTTYKIVLTNGKG